MKPGEVVDLEPGQCAAYVDDMARRFVTHNAQPLPEVLEELRAWVVYSDRMGGATLVDKLAARLLSHVEQLHAGISQAAELLAGPAIGPRTQAAISKQVFQLLATFDPPEA